jgi:hypothetical protein
MWELRLGDEIDDFCVKCRRLTNHLVVSLVDGKAAKVRCRSCYTDHDYRNEQAPPSKKELAKQKELFNSVLAGIVPPEEAVADLDAAIEMEVDEEIETATEIEPATEIEIVPEPAAPPAPAKKKKR